MSHHSFVAKLMVVGLTLLAAPEGARAAGQTRQAKDLDERIAELREAVRLRPQSDEAHRDLADALLTKGALDDAVASFREALRLNPTNASAFDGLGVALRRQGKLAEAEACCRQAVRLDPKSARAYTNLGLTLIDQKKQAEAVASFNGDRVLHFNHPPWRQDRNDPRTEVKRRK